MTLDSLYFNFWKTAVTEQRPLIVHAADIAGIWPDCLALSHHSMCILKQGPLALHWQLSQFARAERTHTQSTVKRLSKATIYYSFSSDFFLTSDEGGRLLYPIMPLCHYSQTKKKMKLDRH